jgi:serine phosphatase RsbU (regulator of sigma subunit)
MDLTSLKAKFIAVTVVISLLIGLLMLVTFHATTSRIIHDLALRFATREALLERNKIIALIDREVALAQKMADDTAIRTWAGAEQNRLAGQQAFTELESYRRLFRDRSFFVALAASNHYYVYNKGKGHQQVEMVTLDAAKADDKWFYEGMRTIDNYALNLDYNPTLHEAKVWFNAVMKNDRGEKIGICGGGITLTDFLNEIVQSKNKGVATILIDQAGVIQAHEDRAIVEHNANVRDAAKKITIYRLLSDPGKQGRLHSALELLTTGRSEVEAFPVSVGTKDYLLAVSSLQGIGWFNVVLVDVSRVISMQQFLPIVMVMALALLMAIVLIGLLLNRLVLAPLARLSTASREVAAGRYDITLPVTGKDELAALTGSFNAMTATVLDHTNNLESKVRERTDELMTANRLLNDSRQRILDSISYARMIQASILPDEAAMERCLGEHFILYRPKELVGGDFYYLRELPGHFLVAVIDCTGHGIPGAFMTMTVNSILNQVVDLICHDDPARILTELNRILRATLHLQEVDAGLDIALCLVERTAGRLIFAGAGLTLFVTTTTGLREIRGNHQRIGYKDSRFDYAYANHELHLGIGDCCYLTTDGLLDEPGGSKGYGFGAKRFTAAVLELSSLSMPAQLAALERTLTAYRGNHHQRDDITLLGFRLLNT